MSELLTKDYIKVTDDDDRFLQKMPPRYASILKNSDKKYRDLATLNNIPIGTVRSRMHRARNMLLRLRSQPT